MEPRSRSEPGLEINSQNPSQSPKLAGDQPAGADFLVNEGPACLGTPAHRGDVEGVEIAAAARRAKKHLGRTS